MRLPLKSLTPPIVGSLMWSLPFVSYKPSIPLQRRAAVVTKFKILAGVAGEASVGFGIWPSPSVGRAAWSDPASGTPPDRGAHQRPGGHGRAGSGTGGHHDPVQGRPAHAVLILTLLAFSQSAPFGNPPRTGLFVAILSMNTTAAAAAAILLRRVRAVARQHRNR